MIAVGQTVAGYQIEELIGQGGMGVVYRAFDPDLNRMVAIKLIRPEWSSDPAFRSRFDRERKAHANLDHPNIVDIRRSGESEQGLYLAMKFIDGPSLSRLLSSEPLSPRRSLEILAPVGEALDFAHGKGTIHRDLKPQNVLIGSDSRPYLTDFGLAWAPDQTRMTTTGGFIGTAAYASPEQLRGMPTSARSDVYSLSCVLFECLTGEVPFPRDSHLEVAFAHAADDRPRPSATNPALPAAIDEVVVKGMALDEESRFSSAGEMMNEMTEAIAAEQVASRGARRQADAGSGGLVAEENVAWREPAVRGIRGPYRYWMLVAVLAAAAAAAAFLLGNGNGDTAAAKLTSSASTAKLAVRFPDEWRATASAPTIAGLDLEQPLHLRERGAGATLSAGTVRTGGKLLLPRSFLERLEERPVQDEVVDTSKAAAYRYTGLRPAGAPAIDLYVLPTTEGVVTVACQPHGDSAAAATCGRVVSTLSLRTVRPYALGPSTAYGRTLNRTLADLTNRRGAGRQSLHDARTAADQAAAAADLRQAFDAAAERLAGIKITPQSAPANAAVTSALRRAASAYGQLASAATRDTEPIYDRARTEVKRAEREVSRSLRHLERLGYRIGRR